MDRIWVTRHGHTPHTDTSTLNADVTRQIGLDDVGREQARQIGATLRNEPIDVCLVSEFARVQETAALALGDRDVPIEVRPELNEVRCGDYFEGRTYGEYFQWCVANGLFTAPPGENGVCLADTLLRLHAAYAAIVERPEKTALVVTHGFPVSFARRMADLVVGEMLFPFPPAEPAELYSFDVADIARGLDQIPDRVRAAAQGSPEGRTWLARAFPPADPHDSNAVTDSAAESPVGGVRDTLAAIWRRILGVEHVDDDSDWWSFEPGSRTPLLCAAIADELGVELPLPTVYRDRTLRQLTTTIESGNVPERITSVVPLRTGDREPTLVYVPGVFGEDLHALTDLCDLDHPVRMLRAPGLDAGDTPLDSLTALAAHYVSVLTGIVDDRPLVFTGFSAGGTIAVEMARLVRPKGWDVRRVVLIDTLPPGDGFDDLDDEDLMAYRLHTILARVSAQTGRTAPHCLGEPLTDATAAEVVDYLHGVDSSFLPRGVPWEYLERRLRVYATGMRAANTFHGEPCDVPLGYIRTTDGRSLGVSWAKATTSRWYDVLDVDRTHSTLWGDGTVTRALTRFLDEVARDAADPA